MSLSDVVGHLSAAIQRTGEVIAVATQTSERLDGAFDSLEQVSNSVAGAKGDIPSPDLEEALAVLQIEAERLQGMRYSLAQQVEKMAHVNELCQKVLARALM